ncbi:pyridoxal phosphate-dependent aminotransferase [Granulicella sibirica]|uniref:Periplasmic aromatic amino acid aminotransferase beta n=1 Tax=Granulicella sibirica TaxID=2479048 RepID=A0A4Q0SXX7_9BACT|nr:pyridoxal phosphate-dependent aminotransferase [Granulicella sibirica]RXH55985.1 Periplasmic aromatic amino acid aminotransferase beta precursor [Granulicella sibirica]
MKSPLVSSAVSRRSFLFSAGIAASLPVLTESHFAFAAFQADKPAPKPMSQQQMMKQFFASIPPDAVLINANENPLGPCEAARSAIASVAGKGGRYDIKEMMTLVEVFASQNSIPADNFAVYAGSSEPLHYSVLSYTGPTRSFVAGDPTYEAGGRAAEIAKAKVCPVPLTKTYAHDVKAMAAKDPNAGVIYICNPNNPTGTITSREDILWLLENKPKDSMLLVDEAYIHLSDAQSVVDQTANRKDIIVLRTFSKIYGMAGIRCGFAVAHPDVLHKLELCGQNAMPVTSSIAARVSLEDTSLIPTRKAYIANARNTTLKFLADNNYKVIPGSQSNCFMIDTGRNGHEVMAAMAQKKVIIGRTWAVWPSVVRITVGTNEDMAKFRVAYKEVMDAPPTKAQLEYRLRNPVAPHFS